MMSSFQALPTISTCAATAGVAPSNTGGSGSVRHSYSGGGKGGGGSGGGGGVDSLFERAVGGGGGGRGLHHFSST